MAYEVKPWKKEDSSLSIPVARVTSRETFSQEINKEYGEGGGLNANYQQAEAIAIISNALGVFGLRYNFHFVFKTCGDEVILDFQDKSYKKLGENILKNQKLL